METITHGRTGDVIIGIDCAPMTPRPDNYIKQVVTHLGITDVPETSNKSFGAWTWIFENITNEVWEESKKFVIAECRSLYSGGSIRGAEHYWRSAIRGYMTSKITIKTLYLSGFSEYDMRELLSDEDTKKRFTEDFDFAKSVVDELFVQAEKQEYSSQEK